MTREALAMTILITPAGIDPRRFKLHRSCSQRQLARLSAAVAHHQGVPLLATLAAMELDVIIDFGLECFDQHPPCTLARDLVQQQKLLTRFPSIPLLDYFQHRWRLPSNPAPTGRLHLVHAEGYAAFFMCASDPQLSVITQISASSAVRGFKNCLFSACPF